MGWGMFTSCETRMGFRVVGGDNTTEPLASVTKKQLRRHRLISVTNDSIEHRNLLAVHHINKKPGLHTVLTALKKIRELYVKLAARQQSLGSSAVDTLKKNMLQHVQENVDVETTTCAVSC